MPFGVLRSYAEFLRVPTNKMQFQLFQVIKCVIDLLPWQCLRARRRTGRNDAYASLSFVFCKWRKMVLNYSDEEKKRMRDAIRNWKRRWRGVWTWVRCWCSQPWHHGARARTHYFSEFCQLYCAVRTMDGRCRLSNQSTSIYYECSWKQNTRRRVRELTNAQTDSARSTENN